MPHSMHTIPRSGFTCRYLMIPALLGILVLSGCMVGPDFKPSSPVLPGDWSGPVPETKPAGQDMARWWTVFNDPVLTSLEERALGTNLDLKQAASRIRQARAARRVAGAGIGPTVDASGDYRRSRSPGAGNDNINGISGDSFGGGVSDQYQVGFDAGWEIDIFGGVRRGMEASDADILAAVESRQDVLVTLTAEVAVNYINFRALQERIAIAEKNLAAQEHSAELTRKRFGAGFVGALDVSNAEAQVAATSAQIPLLEAQARRTIYSLSLLMGQEPGALVPELSPGKVIPAAVPAVPIGVPSDLLRRRPDIRLAESQIHAATARIGVAEADLFPKFTISGSAGLQASDFGSTFNWAQRFWSIGPGATWTAFDSGRTRANIEIQKALQEQSVITYRQTVLTALQEVENALISSSKEQMHHQALARAVAADKKAVDLATLLYTQGQTDFLTVIDAQRSLYAAEDALAQSKGTLSTNLVALYKALGGGWSENQQVVDRN